MKLIMENWNRFINEELDDSTRRKLDGLLNHEDAQDVMQGIDFAQSLGAPIIISKKPNKEVFNLVQSISDPEVLTSLSSPQNHPIIQAIVANNQNTPIEAIKQIAHSDKHAIRAVNYARKNLELYKTIMENWKRYLEEEESSIVQKIAHKVENGPVEIWDNFFSIMNYVKEELVEWVVKSHPDLPNIAAKQTLETLEINDNKTNPQPHFTKMYGKEWGIKTGEEEDPRIRQKSDLEFILETIDEYLYQQKPGEEHLRIINDVLWEDAIGERKILDSLKRLYDDIGKISPKWEAMNFAISPHQQKMEFSQWVLIQDGIVPVKKWINNFRNSVSFVLDGFDNLPSNFIDLFLSGNVEDIEQGMELASQLGVPYED